MLPESANLDVRRLAALDMHGARGTLRRRRIILAEFVFGVVGGIAIAAWVLSWGTAAGVIVAVCVLGLAANYVPLTAHVVALWRTPALESELAGADLRAELRRYTRAQMWVLVPFWIAGLALVQARRRASRRGT